MPKKILVGSGFKMRKSVEDSIFYIKKINYFLERNNFDADKLEIFILASFLSLYPMAKVITNPALLKLGAQNCWYEDSGAFTGEVSPLNLKEIGVIYVEVGHPERRDIFKEDHDVINLKIKACIRNGLKPILFIGERGKNSNKKASYKFLKNELKLELDGIKKEDLKDVVIAYEPIWAIGAQEAASVDYIEDSLYFLRELFKDWYGQKVSDDQFIFYGGSVNLSNAAQILKIKGNNGTSSGRGAMEPDYFIEMIKLAWETVEKIK